MPVIVPFLLIGAGAASAIGGVANAARGSQKMRQARQKATGAHERYEAELAETQEATEATSSRLRTYGDHQEAALDAVVHRMIDFMRRHNQTVAERASELLAGVDNGAQKMNAFGGAKITAEGVAGHLVTTAIASAVTYTGVPVAVATYGTASTGTAIAGLSGAAAQNATLAWLGGGSIAAGGGGVALGAMALNAVAIGPAVLVGGFVLNGKGEKALTEAHQYCADIDKSVDEQRRLRGRLSLINQRVGELEELLANMSSRGTETLDELESLDPFDPDQHTGAFRQALSYAIAVRDIVAVPILAADGTLDPTTEHLLIRYRGMT